MGIVKNLLKSLSILVAVVVAVEAASFLTYRARFGENLSLIALIEELERDSSVESEKLGVSNITPGHLTNKRIHPFMGHVMTFDVKQLNEFGTNGPSPLEQRPDDEFQVAIVGGSVAKYLYFHLLEHPEALTNEFIKELPPGYRSIRIVSLTVDGHKQPQQLMSLAYFLSLGAKFNLVINVDGFNELVLSTTENYEDKVSLSYPRQWRFLTQHAYSTDMIQGAGKIFNLQQRKEWLRNLVRRSLVLKSSAFILTIWRGIDRQLANEIAVENDRLQTKLRSLDTTNDQFGEPLPSSFDDAVKQSLALWRDGSRQLSKLCKQNGILYVHALQPNQYVKNSRIFTPKELVIAVAPEDFPYRRVVEDHYSKLSELGRTLRNEGIHFIDLTGLYRDIRSDIYADVCCHVNEKGNELLARAVGREIRALLSSLKAK